MDPTKNPRRIRPLSPQLANQIAAGEVVERPASVIKELVENSLDAGARRIEIDVEQSGLRLIRVRDDGSGIHRDDLLLGVSRHATSKIYDQAEMEGILTLGFRGEALASIASICRLRILSCLVGSEAAWSVGGSAGSFEGPQPAAHPTGTTVEVRDLFFNAPARRKFLKSERTEFGHIEDVIKRLALGRFDVGFALRHDKRPVLTALAPLHGSRAADGSQRITAVCGRAFSEQATPVQFEAAGLSLRGWVSGRDFSRGQADLQYFYVNGRSIRDRLVAHALRQVYLESLPAGRHPAYVLYLQIDPRRVDVNVHPTKHEVRFRDARLVHDFLVRALREVVPVDRGEWSLAEPPPVPAYLSSATIRVKEAASGAPAGRFPAPAVSHRVLTQVGRYLVAENSAGLLLVDIQAAERHRLERRLLPQAGAVSSRPLLIPETLALSPGEMALLAENEGRLGALGLLAAPLGGETAVVREIPLALDGSEPAALLRAALEALGEGGDEQRILGAMAASAAASRAASRLSADALEAVVREVETMQAPAKGIARRLGVDDLERLLSGIAVGPKADPLT